MNSKYLFLYLLTLSVFAGCTTCEECGNLYYEPTIRVVFMKSGGRNSDSVKTTIKVFNGDTRALDLNGDSALVNRKKARYGFPIRMDVNETTYNLSYDVFTYREELVRRNTTGIVDSLVRVPYTQSKSTSFTLKYEIKQDLPNDRFLLRAMLNSQNAIVSDDSVRVICNDSTANCYNNTASIYIYE